MYRNNTAFWLHYTAWNTSTNAVELGDAANHTLKLIVDGVMTDPINTQDNIALGECRILIDEVESNLIKSMCVAGISSTPNVVLIPAMVTTDLLKPGISFVGYYTAWDGANNEPKINDTGNHSITIAQDNTSAGATNAPSEIDAADVPGLNKITATAAEATGRSVSLLGESSTADINIIATEYALFNVDNADEGDVRLGTDYAEATLTGTAAIPLPVDVRSGVPTDDTVGNYVPADVAVVLDGEQFGSLGTEFTGTLVPTQASYELPQAVIIEDEEIIIFEGCEP